MKREIKKCFSKGCKDKAYTYYDGLGTFVDSCIIHKPMGWKRKRK